MMSNTSEDLSHWEYNLNNGRVILFSESTSIQVIKKDITTIEQGVIVHQVNCQGKMNSGVAKAIREKWPHVFEEFETQYQEKKNNIWLGTNLGNIQVVEITPPWLYVVNLYGQQEYGYDGKRYTSYAAWEKALPILRDHVGNIKPTPQVYFPYQIGCCRGGGNFAVITGMIAEYFPNAIYCKS